MKEQNPAACLAKKPRSPRLPGARRDRGGLRAVPAGHASAHRGDCWLDWGALLVTIVTGHCVGHALSHLSMGPVPPRVQPFCAVSRTL